jgi:hypothetical protein
MSILIAIIITATIVFIWQEYRFAVIIPVSEENPSLYFFEWHNFIEENISSCNKEEQCQTSARLLVLFHRFFRGKVDQAILDNSLNDLWEHLDKRYRAITKEEKISDLFLDQLI